MAGEEHKKILVCSFCGRGGDTVEKLFAAQFGDTLAMICTDCAYEIVKQSNWMKKDAALAKERAEVHKIGDEMLAAAVDGEEERLKTLELRKMFQQAKFKTPAEFKELLDETIVGQDEAKTALCVAVYNHYKRILSGTTDISIKKSNVLLYGPSGSGKTFLVSTLARALNVPFVVVDANSLTQAGYAGEDADAMVQKLYAAANYDLTRAQCGIIYIDEIDKISGQDNTGKDVSGVGVQQALLKIVEGTKIAVRSARGQQQKRTGDSQVLFDTTNVLFIAAGAFVGLDRIIRQKEEQRQGIGFTADLSKPRDRQMLRTDAQAEDFHQFGLIPELIGRFPVKTKLRELTKEDYVNILYKPKDSLIRQYERLLAIDGVKLSFDREALETIAQIAMEQGTGARGLQAIMETVMQRPMFELPSHPEITEFTVTKDLVIQAVR